MSADFRPGPDTPFPIPVLGIAGWSGAGKTTLVERLLPILAHRGVRTAVIKHDVHGASEDEAGKDSWRFRQAGAQQCILCAPGPAFPHTLSQALAQVAPVELVLVEGFKRAPIPQIGVARAANGKGFTDRPQRFLALVTDALLDGVELPQFLPDQVEEIAAFILQHREEFLIFPHQFLPEA